MIDLQPSRDRRDELTGTPAVYVPIAETVRSFREILDGAYDGLPESAFLLKGSIEDVEGRGGRRSQKTEEA